MRLHCVPHELDAEIGVRQSLDQAATANANFRGRGFEIGRSCGSAARPSVANFLLAASRLA